MNANEAKKIQLGDYIVIQRQKYTKLQKFGSLDATAVLGKEQLELKGLLDQPYSATFKMSAKETTGSSHRGRQRLHTLQLCSDETELRCIREVLGISSSGADNRDILDDGASQALKTEDIEQLRDECGDSTKLIEKIVENSKTFHSKTAYSQEKYLRKKEKKYFEFVQIRKPNIRLLTEIFYRQEADKIMGIRMDTLSQILSYSGICGFGNYLLYESGTNGLLPASFLNSMGAGTEASLVHMHPGNVPQRQAILALNLPQEQLQRCVSVNIYSVLREYYQASEENRNGEALKEASTDNAEGSLETEGNEPSNKKLKLDVETEEATTADRPQKWQLENKRACSLMHSKFNSLVIAAKEHPSNILHALLPLVKPSSPVVIFSLCREVLMDLYVELKADFKVTNLHLTSNWLRMYQILPNRSHPEVNMNANSGYLLSGYTIS